MDFLPNILAGIGRTPLVRLNKVTGPRDATVLAKCEFLNPGGSVKDRMALYILEKAEREGKLRPGGVIVENTSGNTGFGVALAAAVKGYRCIFTMPDKMSTEKVNMLKALGAEVIVTPTNVPADSPESYYETAKRLAREIPGAFYLNQYHNPDNPDAHYRMTAPEIWEQSGGQLDAFVAGLGTGGTMTGVGRYLKEKKPAVKNIGADPIGSVYHSYFKTGKLSTPRVYKVEGIGEDMLCGAMDFSVLDDVRQVDDKQSFIMARRLAREEGIFCGGSSGAAVHVAREVAHELGTGKYVVVILPDSGDRYISKFYSDEWMKDNGFFEPEQRFGTVRDLLGERASNEVVTARADEPASAVVERMKRFGISQMPIVDAKGTAAGMIHEVDLLNFLLEGRHRMDEPIAPIVSRVEGVISPDAPVQRLREIFAADNVAVVQDQGRVVGIVTKLDLIEYLGRRMSSGR